MRPTDLLDYHPPQGRQTETHRHADRYQLTLVTSGGGTQVVDGQEFSLQAGGLYLIAPGVPHACAGRFLQGLICHPDQKWVDAAAGRELAAAYYFARLPPEAHARAQALLRDLTSPAALREVLDLLRSHEYARGAELLTSTHALVGQFLALARVQCLSGKGQEWYATQLHCSTNYLGTCVRAQLGTSPGKIIQDLRLAEAKVRLRRSEKSVGAIAGELLFKDANYFWRFFKKRTGETPRKFRERERRS